MKRILRRLLVKDLQQRLLSLREEQVTDDEQGAIEEISTSSLYVCQACGRPLEKIEEIRGRCVACGLATCVTCTGACAVCKRPLCGRCRAGFAEKAASVCDDCLLKLQERLSREDRLLEDKAAFERIMTVYGAEMKLIQLLTQDKGTVMELIGQIAQLRLAGKLNRMERQITQERDHGKRLLP